MSCSKPMELPFPETREGLVTVTETQMDCSRMDCSLRIQGRKEGLTMREIAAAERLCKGEKAEVHNRPRSR